MRMYNYRYRFSQYIYNGKSNVETILISIGNNVWWGCNATILKGVKIGDGAVIAANTVVTRDVPSGCIVARNLAKTLKEGIEWKR